MIGTALSAELETRGHDVIVLTRGRLRAPNQVKWDLARGVHDLGRLEGIEAVFNLTGAPIATRPWTKGRRAELFRSRVDATAALTGSLQQVGVQLKAFIGPGGLGYFGDRGNEVLHDDAAPGEGFLAELDQAWEKAHLDAAAALKCRGAVLRMALVLDPFHQVFPLMLQPFKLGIGGWLGDGEQYLPFITTQDCVGAFVHILENEAASGAMNGAVPQTPTNREWSEALAFVLGRKLRARAPEWALRGAFGEFADSLFLASVRAVPTKLTDTGYVFANPDSQTAFRWLVDQRQKGLR